MRDVEPGEIVVAEDGELKSIRTHCGGRSSFCVFEYVYFARPDSVVEGVSVHEARQRAGRILYREHPIEADVVIGVPDSGLDAALGYSRESGIPTASASSRTATSGAPSSSPPRASGKTRCASSSTSSPRR